MELTQTDFVKLLVSILIGSVIGAEREYRNKSAGFRTIIITCLGSTLFTMFSLKIGSLTSPERIASNIVVGIGFLGAGVIFKDENRISGLTTATTIWIASALGMGVGGGYFLISAVAAALVLAVLYGFMLMEKKIDAINKSRKYKIVCIYEEDIIPGYERVFKELKLHSARGTQSKVGTTLTGNWMIHGSAKNHEKLIKVLIEDKKIIELDF